MPQPYCTCDPLLCATVLPLAASRQAQCGRELWLQVQADAGVSPVGCSPAAAEGPTHGQEAQHSYARSEGKERRNLDSVRTEYLSIQRILYILLAVTHSHPCLSMQPSIFLQAQKGHQSMIHQGVFPGSLKQMVTFERDPQLFH